MIYSVKTSFPEIWGARALMPPVSYACVPVSYKRPITAVKDVEGRGMGRRCPLPSRLGCLGERRKLTHRGLGGTPAANDFGGVHVQLYAVTRISECI